MYYSSLGDGIIHPPVLNVAQLQLISGGIKMATNVVRIRRKGGEIIQDCDIYIGRSCYQGGWRLTESKWSNPYKTRRTDKSSVRRVIEKYETYVRGNEKLMRALPELRGKTLGCWCKPGPCHGDILIKLLEESSGAEKDPTEILEMPLSDLHLE